MESFPGFRECLCLVAACDSLQPPACGVVGSNVIAMSAGVAGHSSVTELGLFPQNEDLARATPEVKFQRAAIFWSSSACLTALALLFVYVVGYLRGPAEHERKSDVGRYTKSDVLFAVFQITLVYGYLGCGLYAGLTNRIVDGVPTYEFFLLALSEVLMTSCIHAVVKKTGKVGVGNVLEAMMPFGDRFDLFRDATAVANYCCIATSWSVAATAVVLSTNVLGNIAIFWRRDDLRQLRATIWPANASTAKSEVYQQTSDCPTEVADAGDCEALRLLGPPQDYQPHFWSWFPGVERACFDKLGKATSHAKKIASLYQQLPQALASSMLMVMEKGISPAIAFCAGTAWFQAFMIETLRPHVLSHQAKRGIPWQNVSPRDLARARCCSSWDPVLGRRALQLLVLDQGVLRDDREAAARALGEEFAEATKTSDEEVQKCLKQDQTDVFAGLVAQDQESVLKAFAASSAFIADDAELTVAPAKAHKWSMVALLLNHMTRANVNFCQLTEAAFRELMENLKAELPLEYVNLNDNPLCESQDGLAQLKLFMAKAQKLTRLRLQRSVANQVFLAELRVEWSKFHSGNEHGLEIELPKPK
ncbi:unnamed protein product [Effrenium voratum]|uniref:Uncharacterized protein n=1 Tax=Effrenium voratum TaxID=2562239 RepID=A0AA36HU86_9DINO|nr:unnamed protein product [Effrenium voratum]